MSGGPAVRAPVAAAPARTGRGPAGWVRSILPCLLPILVTLGEVPFTTPWSTFWPWRPNTIDLDVYRTIGRVVLNHGDIIAARSPGYSLAFIYPPVTALLAVPLAVVSYVPLQVVWESGIAVSVCALVYRLGLRGWPMGLTAAVICGVVEPVRSTIGYGQINTFVVLLVVADLVPLVRRHLPEGLLTGFATVLKVTPALFVVYLALLRRWRAALWLVIGAGVPTLVGIAVFPRASIEFWKLVFAGDTRTGTALYLMNQSILGGMLRLTYQADGAHRAGIALSIVVGAVGVAGAALISRRGFNLLAVSLVGVTTLLASPLSWTHHFVWVVPLGFALADSTVPFAVRVIGWPYALWVAAAPFKWVLASGNSIELTYHATGIVLSVIGPAMGIALLVVALLVGWSERRDAVPSIRTAA